MRKITIAIDGFSSTGKSTLARQLANSLGYTYVDTGAMYRAVTLYALRHGLIGEDKNELQALVKLLPRIRLKFVFNGALGISEIYLNGENVEQEIRSMEVSNYVSQVAAVEEVRFKLVDLQKRMGEEKGIVMDGRDIGTVVFPDAELKLYMTASPEVRAQRRYKELLEKGQEVSYEQVLENVRKRDHIDTTREISPLTKAADAIEFDNSDMSMEEQFERVRNHALRIIREEA